MEIRPSMEEVRSYASAGEYKYIPVSTSIMSDIKTPIEVLKILKNVSTHTYMLESMENNENRGRYTFLGFDPKLDITCANGVMKVGDETIETSRPGDVLRNIMKDYKSPKLDFLPPFAGGLVGYFSYDYVKYAEPSLDLDAEDREGFKDVDLMLFDKVIAFDSLMQKIILMVNIRLDDIENEYERAGKDLASLIDLIRNGKGIDEKPGKLLSDIRPLFGKEEYCSMVEKAKYHIKEGDIFQIVLSNRLEADFEGSLLNVYRILRTTNPSPYMFYFSGTDVEVAGASPETLVKLDGDTLYTYPLAGTRPRGRTEEEDLQQQDFSHHKPIGATVWLYACQAHPSSEDGCRSTRPHR